MSLPSTSKLPACRWGQERIYVLSSLFLTLSEGKKPEPKPMTFWSSSSSIRSKFPPACVWTGDVKLLFAACFLLIFINMPSSGRRAGTSHWLVKEGNAGAVNCVLHRYWFWCLHFRGWYYYYFMHNYLASIWFCHCCLQAKWKPFISIENKVCLFSKLKYIRCFSIGTVFQH